MSEIKLQASPHKLKNQIITCTEQLPACLGKFIPTRRDQPDICFKCLVTLGIDEAFPPLEPTKNIKL